MFISYEFHFYYYKKTNYKDFKDLFIRYFSCILLKITIYFGFYNKIKTQAFTSRLYCGVGLKINKLLQPVIFPF